MNLPDDPDRCRDAGEARERRRVGVVGGFVRRLERRHHNRPDEGVQRRNERNDCDLTTCLDASGSCDSDAHDCKYAGEKQEQTCDIERPGAEPVGPEAFRAADDLRDKPEQTLAAVRNQAIRDVSLLRRSVEQKLRTGIAKRIGLAGYRQTSAGTQTDGVVAPLALHTAEAHELPAGILIAASETAPAQDRSGAVAQQHRERRPRSPVGAQVELDSAASRGTKMFVSHPSSPGCKNSTKDSFESPFVSASRTSRTPSSAAASTRKTNATTPAAAIGPLIQSPRRRRSAAPKAEDREQE